MVTTLDNSIEKNLNLIYSNMPLNDNFITRNIKLKGNISCYILYINGLVNQQYIENSILYPLLFKIDEELYVDNTLPKYLAEKYIPSYNIKITNDVISITNSLKRGKCVILVDNSDNCLICNTTGGTHRAVTESNIERHVRGDKESFVENLEMNISIIQQKLRNSHFKMEEFILGKESENDVVLMYIDNLIDTKILNNIRNKLNSINAKYLPDTGYIAQYIEGHKFSFFPQTKTTEKPDKVISDMLQGKAVIMINGSPQVIILPAVFIEFFQAFEDYSNRFFIGNIIRILRVISSFIVIFLGPMYLVLLEYNAELIPISLIKIIINSRLGIPLNPFLELLFMEFFIELLREGGLRLPTPIGQTLSIIGGIILGDAATKSGIVSPTTLVVVALSVIASFLIPNYEMSLSIRFLRFPMLLLSKLFGFFGIITGAYLLLLHLTSIDSFGIPYLTPLAPLKTSGFKDLFIKMPINSFNKMTNLFKFPNNKEH